MSGDIRGIRDKIDRAEQHLDELKSTLKLWVASTGNAAQLRSTEEHPDRKDVIFDLKTTEPPPLCSLQVGDAVHNLRSVLDHLVYQLVPSNHPGRRSRKLMFPVFLHDTPDNRKSIKNRIAGIPPLVVTAIETLQPYERRKSAPDTDPLWLLSELDNIDKHRLVLVIDPKFADGKIRVQIGDETAVLTLSKVSAFRPLKLGTIPLKIALSGASLNAEVKVDAAPTMGIVFAQTGLKCDGSEVFPTLRDIIADVKTIVDDFERRFF